MKYIIMFKLHIGACLATPTIQGHAPALKIPKVYLKFAKMMIFRIFWGRGLALLGGSGPMGGSGQAHPNMKFEHNNIFLD